MDQDIEDPFDLSDPLDIQENELMSSEQNVAIDPMSVCNVEIKNEKLLSDFCDQSMDMTSKKSIYKSLSNEKRPFVCPT